MHVLVQVSIQSVHLQRDMQSSIWMGDGGQLSNSFDLQQKCWSAQKWCLQFLTRQYFLSSASITWMCIKLVWSAVFFYSASACESCLQLYKPHHRLRCTFADSLLLASTVRRQQLWRMWHMVLGGRAQTGSQSNYSWNKWAYPPSSCAKTPNATCPSKPLSLCGTKSNVSLLLLQWHAPCAWAAEQALPDCMQSR